MIQAVLQTVVVTATSENVSREKIRKVELLVFMDEGERKFGAGCAVMVNTKAQSAEVNQNYGKYHS